MRRHGAPAVRLTLAGGWVARCALALIGMALLALPGCLPPQASFSPGLGTQEIRGVLELPGPDAGAGPPLIVVFLHHSLMTGFAGEPAITRQTVMLATVGPQGEFRIPMPQDVLRVDILFAAPERLTDTFHFQRQLGIGTVTYTARLPVAPDWRGHFYTYLAPQLEHLIVETRYGLSTRDQERLSQWLSGQKRRLAAPGQAPQGEKSSTTHPARAP